MASDEQVRRRGRWLAVLVVLALAAIADGAYLSWVHVDLEVGKPGAGGICHALARDGCTVTGGRFGDVAGVPVALIGFAGACATVVAAIGALVGRRRADDPWRAMALVLAMVSVGASAIMATLSTIEGSYCPFCVAWYGLNLGMFVAARAAVPEHARDPGTLVRACLTAPLVPVIATAAIALSAGIWASARYRADQLGERTKALAVEMQHVLAMGKTEIPLHALPVRGGDDADVTIVEVADFECPFCRRMWDAVHDYVESSGKSVRTVFVHFPLDGSCNPGMGDRHPHACAAAKAAECARDQDRFWEYGALMFDNQHALERDDLLSYAEDLQLDTDAFQVCLDHPATELRVLHGIKLALDLKVRATPTLYVDGYRFEGAVDSALFAASVDTLLELEDAGD